MKGFYIEITNNLLEPKHREAMGESVWLYMWLLDKMTSVNEDGIGKVLGGKPLKYEEIASDLGISERTYSRYAMRLKKGGYINTKRTSFGLIISINKAKKRFGQKSDTPHMAEHDTPHLSGDTPKVAEVIRQISPNIVDKTVRQDNDKTTTTPTGVQSVVLYFFEQKGWAYKGTEAEKVLFRRNLRAAKELLALCDGNIEDAKECILKLSTWAKSRDLEWSIETVFKKWYDIDLLKPKEKKPYYDGARIFQKSQGGQWYIVRPDGIKELGIWPKKEEIIYK